MKIRVWNQKKITVSNHGNEQNPESKLFLRIVDVRYGLTPPKGGG